MAEKSENRDQNLKAGIDKVYNKNFNYTNLKTEINRKNTKIKMLKILFYNSKKRSRSEMKYLAQSVCLIQRKIITAKNMKCN